MSLKRSGRSSELLLLLLLLKRRCGTAKWWIRIDVAVVVTMRVERGFRTRKHGRVVAVVVSVVL